MAVNIKALINCLSKSYQEIFGEGLILYKTKNLSQKELSCCIIF
ncbi:DUF6392 family protein [Photorhabdus temperata]|uniref:Uncharacterized protein n=1 Tax=Photorhabdus temperata subsp. temperata Meg1 TaxID=1393735 RepID=A0A081RQL5_PHOTE|nr:hypothetical protein MEG1DRAFT_04437 [Photorhabdus temperata subsp. temperata Meg1]